jgi:hypothetical protein
VLYYTRLSEIGAPQQSLSSPQVEAEHIVRSSWTTRLSVPNIAEAGTRGAFTCFAIGTDEWRNSQLDRYLNPLPKCH